MCIGHSVLIDYVHLAFRANRERAPRFELLLIMCSWHYVLTESKCSWHCVLIDYIHIYTSRCVLSTCTWHCVLNEYVRLALCVN